MAIDRKSVELVIDELRPQFLMDGGDIQLIDIRDDGMVEISLGGVCGGCFVAPEHVKYGVEEQLKRWVPQVTGVILSENY